MTPEFLPGDGLLLMDWLESPAGQELLQQERLQAARVLEGVFGDQIVQVGCWGKPGWLLESARTQFAAVLAPAAGAGIGALSVGNRLAVLTDSVDAVFLPHTLEFGQDPHGILREVHRVLRPDGKLIVLGFNPMSWWGIRHRLAAKGYPPGLRRQISQRRLSDWLRLLSLGIDGVHACYATAADTRIGGVVRRTQWFASSYVLVATKETMPMTVIRPRLRRKPRLVESLVNTSTRNITGTPHE
jgi:SAM-dependent methyltransferase